MRLTLHLLATLALFVVGLALIAGILWATQTTWGAIGVFTLLTIALLDRLRVFWGWVRSTRASTPAADSPKPAP